ncbi:MAG TPA: hypothetical protein VM103_00985 [Candidatus Paceibacterota bacterium]|nr:hypothetical protein [Candidatus Paceibacterota bacterium]
MSSMTTEEETAMADPRDLRRQADHTEKKADTQREAADKVEKAHTAQKDAVKAVEKTRR